MESAQLRHWYRPQPREGETALPTETELESHVGKAPGRKRADGTPWEGRTYLVLSPPSRPQKPVARWPVGTASLLSTEQGDTGGEGSGGQTEDIQPNGSAFLGSNIHTS